MTESEKNENIFLFSVPQASQNKNNNRENISSLVLTDAKTQPKNSQWIAL